MRRWFGGGAVAVIAIAVTGVSAGASSLPNAPACPMTPADSYWHASVDALPTDPNSSTYVTNAGAGLSLHADFGAGLYAGGPIGIPFVTVPGTQPKVPVSFTYADESDPGPYPIPTNAPIEGGASSTGDRHVLVVDRDHCTLYETFSSYPNGTGWSAGSGAIFDLTSNAMRPRTWTSADAAGLPILPGLVRYDEVAAGEIDHAIRITLRRTDRRYVWPARHQAGVTDATAAPMGAWLRLKPGVDPNRFGPQARLVVRALQRHGAIVADNGSSWYISGAPDDRWDNDDLHGLGALHGSDFEFVDPTSMMIGPDTGQVVTAPVRADLAGGVTLDGFGGLHRFRIGAGPALGAISGAPYWPGWDIARGVALVPGDQGGLMLDGIGGLHGFRLGSSGSPPAARGGPYWPGWDIARDVVVLPDSTGGYVLDGFGGMHPFRLGSGALPPRVSIGPYWPGWDVARGLTLLPGGRTGYVIDALGGTHAVAFGGATPPPRLRLDGLPRMPQPMGLALLPDATGGYTLDALGSLRAFAVGAADPVAPAAVGVTRWAWPIARSVAVSP